jgi:hypothetical protein
MNLTLPRTGNKSEQLAHTLDEVKRALADQADHIAKVAADIGHETSKQAAKSGDEAGKQATILANEVSTKASSIAERFLRGAARIGDQIAASGRKSVGDLGHDVQSMGQELRRVRVTTEPRRKGPDLMPGIALLGGIGAGIALMYFLDPEQGNRRRALLRDQLTKWTRVGRETATGKAKDIRNRTVGVMHEARKAVGVPVGVGAEESGPPTGNGYENADPSPTDTWGTQPAESRLETG